MALSLYLDVHTKGWESCLFVLNQQFLLAGFGQFLSKFQTVGYSLTIFSKVLVPRHYPTVASRSVMQIVNVVRCVHGVCQWYGRGGRSRGLAKGITQFCFVGIIAVALTVQLFGHDCRTARVESRIADNVFVKGV